jgi:hypothetical protein
MGKIFHPVDTGLGGTDGNRSWSDPTEYYEPGDAWEAAAMVPCVGDDDAVSYLVLATNQSLRRYFCD